MADISSLSSLQGAGSGVKAHKHAHHAAAGQFQSLMSNLTGTGAQSSAASTSSVGTQSAVTAKSSSTASVSGALGGLQHVLDLLQGVSA